MKRYIPKPSRNAIIAGLLFVFAFVLVLSSQRQQGIARDETVYMHHGSRYASWWMDFASGKEDITSRESITQHFGGHASTAGNREHPPLMKTLFGVSATIFHTKLGWTSQLTAYRIPTALCNALLIALVFVFVAGIWGRYAGICAALLLLFLPRAFFHAGLATFDAAVVTFWFAALMAYMWAIRTKQGYLWLGLCAGLSLATKHNAILLPAVFIPHCMWLIFCHRNKNSENFLRGLWHGNDGYTPKLLLKVLLGLFVLAPLILVALWPWMWFDTMTHFGEWMAFHFRHVHYNFEYLGENWNAPPFPWHIPLVTTLFTVPVATIVAGLLGFAICIARWRNGESQPQSPALLLFLSAGVAMGPFLLRTTPIFGAEKHWAPAIVSLCIFAGIGLGWAAQRAVNAIVDSYPKWSRVWPSNSVHALVAIAVIGAAWSETHHAQPYALSHYNALAGGASGGASLGMNRQFWGVSAKGVLPFINQHAAQDTSVPVYSHDASPAWWWYGREHVLAAGLPDAGRETAGIAKSNIAIVIHEKHFNRHDYLIWQDYGKVQPSFVLTFDGVPLVSVYIRDGR